MLDPGDGVSRSGLPEGRRHDFPPRDLPRRDPMDYLILVSKEKETGNYSKWQASFLRKSDVGRFQSYHVHDLDRYFLVMLEGLDLPAPR